MLFIFTILSLSLSLSLFLLPTLCRCLPPPLLTVGGTVLINKMPGDIHCLTRSILFRSFFLFVACCLSSNEHKHKSAFITAVISCSMNVVKYSFKYVLGHNKSTGTSPCVSVCARSNVSVASCVYCTGNKWFVFGKEASVEKA